MYPTNYLTSALVIPNPGVPTPSSGRQFDQNGLPSVFSATSAASAYIEQYPGETGTRAIVRLAPFTNFDVAVAKSFPLPWEGHLLQLRAEAFNAFNNVNFYNPSLRLDRPAIFGEYQSAFPMRVMQFALRYQF